MNDKNKNIVVIGGGPAGLTAAYELLSQKYNGNIILLEESGELGGISRTVKLNGNRMDIGGHRFFSKDSHVMKWWQDRMPLQGKPSYDDRVLGKTRNYAEHGPDPEVEDNVMLLRQRVSRIYYKENFFDYPISMKWDTIKNMGFIVTIKAGFSYLASCFYKREEDSLENFYINRFGKVLYSMFFEGYTEKLWGRHPREISADWGAQRVKGLSILAILKDIFQKVIPSKKNHKVETSLIEEFYYPKYGPGQLWERVGEEIVQMDGMIKYHSKVIKLHVDESHNITEVVYEHNGNVITQEADIVLSSMPLKDLVFSMKNQVPKDIVRIAEGLPYRDFVTVGLLVPSLELINKTAIKTLNNIVPDCWIYVQDTDVKLGRIQIFNNWSPYMVAKPEETLFIGLEYFCQEGDAFWNMTNEESSAFAVNELIKMGILKENTEILFSHRERVKKAYPAYFDTYSEIDKVIDHINLSSNLYCIGRNGQHRYNNMDHSMATAFEAVSNIISGNTEKKNVWNVNTESEYHEERK